MLFTPIDAETGYRLRLNIKKIEIPRGHRWKKQVTVLKDGQKYLAWGKSCGIKNCFCDAYARQIT